MVAMKINLTEMHDQLVLMQYRVVPTKTFNMKNCYTKVS